MLVIRTVVEALDERYARLECARDAGTLRWAPAPHAAWLTAALAAALAVAAALAASGPGPAPARFSAFIAALVALGMVFTSSVTAARARWWCGKHGDGGGAFLRAGAGGTAAALALLYASGRGVPGLVTQRFSNGALLAAGFFAGILFPFAARKFPALQESIRGGAPLPRGAVVKMLLLGAALIAHAEWAAASGYRAAAGVALLTTAAAALAAITFAVRVTHYLHLHHWAAGLLFVPVAASSFDVVTLVLSGFSLAQFAEGAARWSCAPLWHSRERAAAAANSW